MDEDLEQVKNNFYKLQGEKLAELIASEHKWPEEKILEHIQREYTEVHKQ